MTRTPTGIAATLCFLAGTLAAPRAGADEPGAPFAAVDPSDVHASIVEPPPRWDGRRPRFLAGPFLLTAHLGAGAEPHGQGTPVAFSLGGQVLWRGLVGLGLELFGSEGTPIRPPGTDPSLADRVSVAP